MTNAELAKELLQAHDGKITTREANEAGLANFALSNLVYSGILKRVAHGVYVSPDASIDEMHLLAQRLSKIVFSHESALWLHGMTVRKPGYNAVTIPIGYEVKRLKREGNKVFYVKPELIGLGAMTIATPFGNEVRSYSPERTVCDCVRSRNKMDISLVRKAVSRYARSQDRDIDLLMSIARAFRVERIMAAYLEDLA